jgi:hypothetical protein
VHSNASQERSPARRGSGSRGASAIRRRDPDDVPYGEDQRRANRHRHQATQLQRGRLHDQKPRHRRRDALWQRDLYHHDHRRRQPTAVWHGIVMGQPHRAQHTYQRRQPRPARSRRAMPSARRWPLASRPCGRSMVLTAPAPPAAAKTRLPLPKTLRPREERSPSHPERPIPQPAKSCLRPSAKPPGTKHNPYAEPPRETGPRRSQLA